MSSHWFLLAIALSAEAQSLVRLPAETAPAARTDGTIAYDPAGQQLFLFGGLTQGPTDDLWVYSLNANQWRQLQPTGEKPARRFGHTLIYDSSRRRLVLFGGQGAGFFNDTWTYEIAANRWARLNPSGPLPNERYGHSAIYETTRDRMIVSHGFTDQGRFDDTWAFEFATNTWRDISPSSNRPLRRCLHHAVYDPEGGQMLLFGGCASGFGPCPLGDLWAFDLSAHLWSQKTGQPSPSPRQHYGTAFDTARNRMIVFGGSGNGLLNDTWEYDPRTGSWKQIAVPNPPPGRTRVEGTYAADRALTLFFGGNTLNGANNELWAYKPEPSPSPPPSIAVAGIVNAFSDAGAAIAPGEIVSIYGERLGPREGTGLAFDAETQRLPTTAANVQVTFNDLPAPFYFVRQDQINAQVPYELESNVAARVIVTRDGVASSEVQVAVQATHPGLYPGVWNQDGTLNSAINPAASGSVVVLFATGQGITSPASPTGAAATAPYPEPVAPVSVEIGGVPAELLFRGQAPGTAGVAQFNVRLPGGVRGSVPVKLRVGSAESQSGVTIEIR